VGLHELPGGNLRADSTLDGVVAVGPVVVLEQVTAEAVAAVLFWVSRVPLDVEIEEVDLPLGVTLPERHHRVVAKADARLVAGGH
jgi:hypothetical protein